MQITISFQYVFIDKSVVIGNVILLETYIVVRRLLVSFISPGTSLDVGDSPRLPGLFIGKFSISCYISQGIYGRELFFDGLF